MNDRSEDCQTKGQTARDMTIPVVRQRTKRPKARTGCRTCKTRHVKCDERKPACLRCVRFGRECGGYERLKAKDQAAQLTTALLPKDETLASSSSVPSQCSSSASLNSLPSSPPVLSPAECSALDHFRLKTVHRLPGSPWALGWERLAAQIGRTEPLVAQAASVLSSIHNAANNNVDFEPAHLHSALSRYNDAMSALRSYLERMNNLHSDVSVEVVLLVSLLFFCFEILHGEERLALLHLRTGMRIFYERKGRASEVDDRSGRRFVIMPVEARSNMDLLIQTFVRLDADFTLTHTDEPYLTPICREYLPSSFHSVEQALVNLDVLSNTIRLISNDLNRAALDSLASECDLIGTDDATQSCLAWSTMRVMSLENEPQLIARIQEAQQSLITWMYALTYLNTEENDSPTHLLAKIQFFLLWFTMCLWRIGNVMHIDRFEEQFDHILHLAERYVKENCEDAATHDSTQHRPVLTLGTYIVPCLGVMAIKSRKSAIRWPCVKLLQSIDLQGIFDSHYLVAFLKCIITREEQRARHIMGIRSKVPLQSHQVPREARFFEVETSPKMTADRLEFYKANLGQVVYTTKSKGRYGKFEVGTMRFEVARPTLTAI